MSHAFADIAFTPSVKAAQQRDGSRSNCARSFEGDADVFNDRLGEAEADFIAAQRSFYMATNDRVALVLTDCAQRVRLKVLGRLVVKDPSPLRSRGGDGPLSPANHPRFKENPPCPSPSTASRCPATRTASSWRCL